MHLRRKLLSPYHYLWALGSAIYYGRPAKKLIVIGVTGTKGKSSVAEMLHATLTTAGHKTALVGTIRFAIGENSRPNLYKMTLPGRGFIQKFLADAVKDGATHAVIEITSEAALQHRHRFLDLNALIFTGLEPEHIESHGSLEKYFAAKLAIGHELERSSKRPRAIVANGESEYGQKFLQLTVEKRIPFTFADALNTKVDDQEVAFDFQENHFLLPQPGRFSVMNALAVIKTLQFLGISLIEIAKGLESVKKIAGRAERVTAGQNFDVVVDYAHTPGSLTALYEAFGSKRKICVLGNTGGGRDRWKRPLMASIAEQYCDEIILTNEDPYDEEPSTILNEMANGIKNKKPHIILDRREAIRAALRIAKPGDVVLITGKGTDPFIMGPHGTKEKWLDSRVAREELVSLSNAA